MRPWWNVHAYVGHAWGGDVVRAIFPGDAGTLAFVEMTLRKP